MSAKEKKLGQFFTPLFVAEFMVDLATKNIGADVLEPSAGKGGFLKALSDRGFSKIKAYEIDEELPNISEVSIYYSDFLKQKVNEKFDLVIGNPPYVRWKNLPKDFQECFSTDPTWCDRINSLADLLYPFIFSSVDALREGGELVFITPVFWTKTLHARQLRKFLVNTGELDCLINFNEMRIFDKVSSTISIFKYIKTKNKSNKPIKIVNLNSKTKLNKSHLKEIKRILCNLSEKQPHFQEGIFEAYLHPQFSNGQPWNPIPDRHKPLLNSIKTSSLKKSPIVECCISQRQQKILLSELFTKDDLEELEIPLKGCKTASFSGRNYYLLNDLGVTLDFFAGVEKKQRYIRLEDVAHIGNGLVSGLDKAFKVLDETKYSDIEKTKFMSVIKAYDLHQYYTSGYTPYIFLNSVANEEELKRSYPKTFSKLSEYKKQLEKRYSYNKYIPWWHWVFLRNWKLFNDHTEKIFCPCKERIDKKQFARFSYVKGNFLPTQDVTAIILKDWVRENIKYIVAILNSDMILTWLKYEGLMRGGVLEFSEKPLSKIPIRLIDWSNEEEILIHNKIVETVDIILQEKEIDPYKQEIENQLNLLLKI